MTLAHANRVATIGQLTASIVHDVNQPIAGVIASAQAALRWLSKQQPDLGAACRSIERAIRDADRAGGVVARVRDLIRQAPPHRDRVDVNEAIREVIELADGEAAKNGVAVHTQLTQDLPIIEVDRVGLQQVMLNLIINAVEAMSGGEGPRELLVATDKAESEGVLVAVRDSGPGLGPADPELAFEPFYTTKPGGLGVGLAICRSIVEAHRGRMWATSSFPRGTMFQFTIPARSSDL
jgi:C4-dicarboxylate-specific signal transduction histidine kinase